MKVAHRLTLACAALMLMVASASAQIPDKFTNLKVLPKDTPKPELIKIMRQFADDLGVRCEHCHYAKVPEDFSSMNFASDQKPEKDIARNMMKLVAQTNDNVDKIFKDDPNHLKVSCFTCHHGNEKPETIADAIVPVLKKDGPDAAATRYRDLRKDYYGSAAYDFTEYALVGVAEDMRKDPAQIKNAQALLNLNLEFYPQSAPTYAQIAETYLAAGDTTTAMTNFDKASQLAPDDPRLKGRIAMIKNHGKMPGMPPKK